jgi:hypothetical protein
VIGQGWTVIGTGLNCDRLGRLHFDRIGLDRVRTGQDCDRLKVECVKLALDCDRTGLDCDRDRAEL